MSRFEVGELAIFVHQDRITTEDCIIRCGPDWLLCRDEGMIQNLWGYYIEVPGAPSPATGNRWFVTPDQLRKRRPPQDWERLCQLNTAPTMREREFV